VKFVDLDTKISVVELEKMSEKMFGRLVKAVVDVEKEIMVVDASMHVDQEVVLLENGSKQENLWGINLHPSEFGLSSEALAKDGGEGWIEFDSLINLRPSQGNRSRSVDDPKIQEKIKKIVNRLVKE